MLNSKQVNLLFQQNAVLIGDVDGIQRYRAAELFGEEAVDYVMGMNCRNGYYNEYGIGNYDAPYLTYRGFQKAATYVNIREIEAQEAAKPKMRAKA